MVCALGNACFTVRMGGGGKCVGLPLSEHLRLNSGQRRAVARDPADQIGHPLGFVCPKNAACLALDIGSAGQHTRLQVERRQRRPGIGAQPGCSIAEGAQQRNVQPKCGNSARSVDSRCIATVAAKRLRQRLGEVTQHALVHQGALRQLHQHVGGAWRFSSFAAP